MMRFLKCSKLIDGTGRSPIQNAILLIDGSRIAAVGQESEVDVPRGAQEIDCSGKTVIPGLVDTHLHFALGPGSNYDEQFQNPDGVQLAAGTVNANFTLESGVTTARDLGARNRVALDLREVERRGIILAPRLLVCGRSITMTGGHFHYCNAEADGCEGVKRITRQLLKEGVDFIKIMTSGGGTTGTRRDMSSYSADEIAAAVEEAHRQGKTVTAHCHATKAIANAVEAGVDIIEHCSFFEPKGKKIQHVFQEDLAREIVRKGIYVDNVLNPQQLDRTRQEWCLDNFNRLRKLGAKLLPGTDGLRLYQTANMATALEMWLKCGISPMEIISTATKMAAEASGVGDCVGTLEIDKEADLVVLDEDPLTDIRTLRDPWLVMKHGHIIPFSGRIEAKAERDRLAEKVLTMLDEVLK